MRPRPDPTQATGAFVQHRACGLSRDPRRGRKQGSSKRDLSREPRQGHKPGRKQTGLPPSVRNNKGHNNGSQPQCSTSRKGRQLDPLSAPPLRSISRHPGRLRNGQPSTRNPSNHQAVGKRRTLPRPQSREGALLSCHVSFLLPIRATPALPILFSDIERIMHRLVAVHF